MKLHHLTISIFIATLVFCCKDPGKKNIVKTEILNSDSLYIATGKNIAAETQSALAKTLMNAISTGGVEYAVSFCNTKALTLTDSMAHLLNARIKRVSDKPRNPANQANENEMEYIRLLKDKMQKGEKPEPKITERGDKMVGLYPIITNTMCMPCHGKNEIDINAATNKKIKELYPADKATGYGINEVRGLWVVEMIKK